MGSWCCLFRVTEDVAGLCLCLSGAVRDGGLAVVVSQTHSDPRSISSRHKDNQECTLQTDRQELKSGLLLSSALGVAVIICTVERLRHGGRGGGGGHWQGQDLHSFSLFFPTQNCGLSLRATGSHGRLESCGQQLVVGAAQTEVPSSQPAACSLPSAGSGASGPL